MRILMLGPFPADPTRIVGGTQSVVSALAPALASLDEVEQVVVLSVSGGGSHDSEYAGVTVLQRPGQRKLAAVTRNVVEVRQARRIVEGFRPDVVHAHGIGWQGDVATQISRHVVVTAHGMVHVETKLSEGGTFKGRLRARTVESMVRRTLSKAGAVISISRYDLELLRPWVAGRAVLLPNPVAPEFFTPAPPNHAGEGLLFAGVLRRRKNVTGLVRAFAQARAAVPGARLTIVGPQPDRAYRQEVADLVTELGLSDAVTFGGHVENQELAVLMRAARVLVLFSREETLPTVIAQAMASGTPAISSDVGGVADMVDDGVTGALVSEGDEAGLALAIVALLRDPETALAQGRAAWLLARDRYSAQSIATKTFEVYESVSAVQ